MELLFLVLALGIKICSSQELGDGNSTANANLTSPSGGAENYNDVYECYPQIQLAETPDCARTLMFFPNRYQEGKHNHESISNAS